MAIDLQDLSRRLFAAEKLKEHITVFRWRDFQQTRGRGAVGNPRHLE